MKLVHTDVYTASYLLKVTPAALYKAMHEGKIQFFHDGRRYWVPLWEIARRLGRTEDELIAQVRAEERLSALDINVDRDS